MANNSNDNIKNRNDHEEHSPLLGKQVEENAEKSSKKKNAMPASPEIPPLAVTVADGYGWTANGLPLGHGSVVGEPMPRTQWNSSVFACLGRNDEFCSSDLEVCESYLVFPFRLLILSVSFAWVLRCFTGILR